MKEIKEIRYKKKLLAVCFFSKIKSEGVRFLTPESFPLQIGLIQYKSGKVIKNHIHRQDIKYKVHTTQEFLYIERGAIKVKIFTESWKEVDETILKSGDMVLFVGGGHGLEVIKDCRIFEVKQGPYPGDKYAKIYQDTSK